MSPRFDELITVLKRLWPQVRLPHDVTPNEDRVSLVTDSRRLRPGDVFVAVPGSLADGRDYIVEALESGASLVLAHAREGEEMPSVDPRLIVLPYLAQRLGELGRDLYAVPASLEVIAVTGTNGKSSVTHYLAALSELLNTPAGLIGTLGNGRPGALVDSGLTTPGPLALQASLGEFAAGGVRRVAVEASSHALDQDRLDGTRVKAAVFTNLSRDHLDYHGSMAAYAAAKARLFRRSELELAVVNGQDPLARLMLAGCHDDVRVLATGEDEAVTLRVLDWQPHGQGQQAMVATPEGEVVLELGLMGRFNLDNVLLAMATLYGLGEPLMPLVEAAKQLEPVPGRMQLIQQPQAPGVVIDYAHTPAALENALIALRAHLGSQGALWCVFGCGGDRDTGKRAEMAKVAERYAEHIVVTDDNPRNEPAGQIREQIMSGFTTEGRKRVQSVEGRELAIAQVVAQAAANDVVLIAGKGHEAYQEIAGVRHPFSDHASVGRALAERDGS
ncbi:UDP-N-acetylmuramoyl-L-alanyl-D-glutamate--2,6-diaminopimelate ligase [Halomonas sp. Bachu 37]|uniref:UDP-N-acetylmuramoyl-L-alanyl-D-glutamate--2, 6-diaminopimelate ligase n=1 Tax=Halomonas kashgarensis TaxID=3084920 RepID=UPI003216E834